MSNMLIINALICVVGFGLGAYTFIRHLQAFSHAKTPTVDSWLVAVGTLAWSVALYASFDDNNITHAELFCRVLFLVYWIGDILKVQKHCIKIRRRFRRNRP
ncbi:hypothetical protein LP123_07570 [Moraxella bovis]|nr:hypothetical protein [Moraxella bovis]AWY20338.1 hypothetical protein DQF64_07415 [Moraxella bovis]UYZ74487.1 hypothetical protein LP093_06755 [Moraxella bovis]UYZ79576.1 hypothetical protein LP115_07085 [Moraxella bovis]UYZ79814.1 hypothetical protein LP113_07015 [Moraxella bovis]UYZ88058.1 hypothetical protein LP094_07095 [Moraxella bovis]